jgi:hypothetical protein
MPASTPGTGPAHRARAHLHARVVGDHDGARLGLPPVVVERPAEGLDAPHHRFRVERLAHAREVPQLRVRMRPCASSTPAFMSMRIAVGAVYQTVTRSFARMLVPAHRVELLAVHQHGHAAGERRDHAVGNARHPARVGGAPVHVAVLQVEHPARRGEVHRHGGVRVQHALRQAGRAAREVQQRVVLGRRPHRLEIRRRLRSSSSSKSSVPSGSSPAPACARPARAAARAARRESAPPCAGTRGRW